MIALNTGFNSEVINDKYSYEMGYHIEYMHLAILPFEKRSIILLFLNKDNKRYDMFIKKMGQLSKTKQIQVINHILFLYCEDYFISKKISTKTLNKIKLLASAIEGPVSMNPTESLKQVISDYDLNNAWSQKNILGIHC